MTSLVLQKKHDFEEDAFFWTLFKGERHEEAGPSLAIVFKVGEPYFAE